MEGCSILQNPVINPQDIIVEVEPLPEFDVKLHVRMPAHCIEKITERLVEGGLEQTDEQLVQILLKVSVDEALSRLERTPLFGPSFVSNEPPSLPSKGQDFDFHFVVDQIPELQLPPFEDLKISNPILDISDHLIECELHSQSLESGEHQTHVGPIESDHRVMLDIQVFSPDSSVKPLDFKNLVGRIPRGKTPFVLNGLKFLDLAPFLHGHKQGDVVDVSISLPRIIKAEGFSSDLHAATVSVVKVESSLPLSHADLVKKYDAPSLAVLKLQIKASLEHRFELAKMASMTEDLFEQLMDSVEYQPSERIVKRRLFEIGQKAFQSHQKNGNNEAEAQKEAEKAIRSVQPTLINQLKRQVILADIVSKYELQFSEQDIQDQIRNLAALQGKRPEDYRQELIESGQINALQAQVLEHKVTRLVSTKAKLVDLDQG